MAVRPLRSFFLNAEELLAADVRQLGAILLVHLDSYQDRVKQRGQINPEYLRAMLENRNVGLGPLPPAPEYGMNQPEVTRAVMEAWNWLKREGMVTPTDPTGVWFTVSRLGEELIKRHQLQERWEQYGVDLVKEDLVRNGGLRVLDVGKPAQQRNWALEWVQMREGAMSEQRVGGNGSQPITTLRRHHILEHGILQLAIQDVNSSGGYPTRLPGLATSFRPRFEDITHRELEDTLKRLRPKYLTLWKWSDDQHRFIEYPTDISNDEEFFYTGDFRLRRTPDTDPRLQELSDMISQETKSPAEVTIDDAGRKARFDRWEELGLDRVKTDLMYTGGIRVVGGPREVQDLAWEWVRMKEQQLKISSVTETLLIKEPSRKVFVVHGRDEAAREKIARFLEQLEFEPIILHEQANRGRTLIEKFEDHSDVGFAVVLLTPDDEGCEKGGTPRLRARQNVVLELGFFVGRLGRNRVCALISGEVEIPSDIAGVVYVPLDNSNGWKQSLGRELKSAGFTLDWNKAMSGNL
jgi:predicted nucleotide-binding protein